MVKNMSLKAKVIYRHSRFEKLKSKMLKDGDSVYLTQNQTIQASHEIKEAMEKSKNSLDVVLPSIGV
jgi:hypothetical protein